jgi:hypothetical protein
LFVDAVAHRIGAHILSNRRKIATNTGYYKSRRWQDGTL